MITLNIDAEGGITISSETLQERAAMSQIYGAQDAAQEASAETMADEERASFFRKGWDAAIQECQVNFVNGRLPEFFNEIGSAKEDYSMTDVSRSDLKTASEDPHHDEPEGTGEADDVPAAGWAKVEDSGEPELESQDYDRGNNQTWDPLNSGTWTMSSDELQSRLDAAYNRGCEQTARQEREAGYQEGFANGQTVNKQTTKRALDIIAVEINNQVVQWWEERQSSDGVIQEPLSKGNYARKFSELLAARLGFEVSA